MIVQVREECNLLFDDYPTIANEHQENEENSRLRKRDRQTDRQREYLVKERALLLLLISNLIFYPKFYSIASSKIMLENRL
jgi:hypothetical protein